MSGLVKDAGIVGLGEYWGAQIGISGGFEQFDNFSQLRIRALEVRTARVLIVYTARIRNSDAILADIAKPLENRKAPGITENALEKFVYYDNEELVITLRASEDCYFVVYQVDIDNNIQVIYPNFWDKDKNVLKAGVMCHTALSLFKKGYRGYSFTA